MAKMKGPDETLNERQRLFCLEYVKDLNATQAAIRAGYSERSAHIIAWNLLRRPAIAEYVSKHAEEHLDSLQISTEEVLDEYRNRAFFDPQDAFEQDGSLKRLKDIPIDVRRCIASLEVTEIFDGQGDQKTAIGLLKKVKFTDKDKALDGLAKYLGLLKERVSHENPDGSPLTPPRIEIIVRDAK